jgi:hypothetical protein
MFWARMFRKCPCRILLRPIHRHRIAGRRQIPMELLSANEPLDQIDQNLRDLMLPRSPPAVGSAYPDVANS